MAQAKSKLVLSLQSQYSLSQQNYVYGIWVEVVVRGFYFEPDSGIYYRTGEVPIKWL